MVETIYKCLSLNVAGLRNVIKRKRIEKFLKREHANITSEVIYVKNVATEL